MKSCFKCVKSNICDEWELYKNTFYEYSDKQEISLGEVLSEDCEDYDIIKITQIDRCLVCPYCIEEGSYDSRSGVWFSCEKMNNKYLGDDDEIYKITFPEWCPLDDFKEDKK